MKRKWLWWTPLPALVMAAILALGGWAIHRTAWTQGYVMGLLADGDGGSAVLPYGPPTACYAPGCPPLLLALGLFLVAATLVGGLLHVWTWRTGDGPRRVADARRRMMAGGRHAEHWSRYWHEHHDAAPPSCRTTGPEPAAETVEEKIEQAGPEEATEPIGAE